MTTTFRFEHNIAGSALSGSDGAANRTYTLANTGYVVGTMNIHVNGAYLYETTDFTVSGSTVTFLQPVYNAQLLNFDYYTLNTTATVTSLPTYATTVQLAQVLGIKGNVPSRQVGTTTMSNEAVVASGGVTAGTVYYLQQLNVLGNTYTLYTGGTTAATATTALTETTHYTIDKENGGITFTSAGSTLVSTNGVYAKYSYITVNVPDSVLADYLYRAQIYLDTELQTTWTDGSVTNPSYPSNVEYQASRGRYDRTYFSIHRPIINVNSLLASTMTSSQNTVVLTTGDGASFPASGSIVIDNEMMTYTGVSTDTLTGVTRGANGSTATTHTAGAIVQTSIMEVSATYEGSTPVWQVLKPVTETELTADVGKWYIYDNQIIGGIYVQDLLHVRPDVPGRIRLTYLYGYTTIPVDITRACLLLAKRSFATDNVMASTFKGRFEFDPSALAVDLAEIEQIMENHRFSLHGNT